MAVNKNISWFVGEDKSITDRITGQDITGWSILFTLSLRYGGPALVTKQTGGLGISLTAPATGDLTISVLRADTKDLVPDDYYYEVSRVNVGTETVLTYGIATLLPRTA